MIATPYKIIRTEKELDTLISYCKKTKYACIDFETSGLEFYNPEQVPLILGISFQIGSAWIVPLAHSESPFKNFYQRILKKIGKEILEDVTIVKVAWNLKFEGKWFDRYGCRMLGRLFDGMLAKYLLDEERPNDLKSIVKRFLPDYGGYEDEVQLLVKKNKGWANVPLEALSKYCAVDCDMELRLMVFFESYLIKYGFYKLFRNLLMMMSRALMEIEIQGMIIDQDHLSAIDAKYLGLIESEMNKVKNHKVILRFQKERLERLKNEYISNLYNEIKLIKKEGKPSSQRSIASREEKIKRVLAGKPSGKDELKIFEPINIGSQKQMVDLLFNSEAGFKFKIVKYTRDKQKRDTDNPATSEDVLLELKKLDKTGFIESLLELRGLNTIYSTFIKGTREKLGEDGRLHTNYKIHGTVTGRLSSETPNLQNLPRVLTNPDIKPMFIPPPGKLLVEMDYSQAELRVVAELANETSMLKWFNEGRNIHVAVAVKAAGLPDEEYERVYKITKDERHPEHEEWNRRKKRAKTINFGILYEQGDKMLAEGMKCTKEEARQFKADWFKAFPRIKKWIDGQHAFVREYGYVMSLFGRKRRLPTIWSEQEFWAMEAQRQAVNSPIQAVASDYTQLAIIIMRKRRILGHFPQDMIPMYTVHDSIGNPISPAMIPIIVPKLFEICLNPDTEKWFGFKLHKVKMKASCELGINWGSYHDYDKNENYIKFYKDQLKLKKHVKAA